MKNKAAWVLLVAFFFAAGITVTYVFLTKFAPAGKPQSTVTPAGTIPAGVTEDSFVLKLFLPHGDRLVMTERKVPRRSKSISNAESVIEEFLASSGEGVRIPADTKLLGIYADSYHIWYLDLSDEFRRNFQGDHLDEFLLLRALYESILGNVPEAQDVKLLIDGKEIDSLGGHFSLKVPLSRLFRSPLLPGGPGV